MQLFTLALIFFNITWLQYNSKGVILKIRFYAGEKTPHRVLCPSLGPST